MRDEGEEYARATWLYLAYAAAIIVTVMVLASCSAHSYPVTHGAARAQKAQQQRIQSAFP